MNQDQITSIVRQLLLTIGGAAVAKGYLDSGTMTAIAGAVAVLVASGWALYTRRNTGLVASAATVPDVQKIVASADTASAVTSTKVVSPPVAYTSVATPSP